MVACVRTKRGFKSASHKQREETFTTIAAGSNSTFLLVDGSSISRIQQFGGGNLVRGRPACMKKIDITGLLLICGSSA